MNSHELSAEVTNISRRCNPEKTAYSLVITADAILMGIISISGTGCALPFEYPAALWHGKMASVERRIHSLPEDDPDSRSIPQFSSSFCPRTLSTVQRAFLCAVLDMCFVTTDILIRSSSPKRSQ